MKKLLMADAQGQTSTPSTTTPAPVVPIAEPTSERLTELYAEYDKAFDEGKTLTDRKAKMDNGKELFRLDKEIAAEIANIRKQEADAKLAVMRNERAAMAHNLVTSVEARIAVNGDKKATDEQRSQAADAEKAALDLVVNELLGKYATSTSSKSVATGDKKPGVGGGKISDEIIALYEANMTAGMSNADNVKDIISKGYSRGTTGAVTLAYRTNHGIKV